MERPAAPAAAAPMLDMLIVGAGFAGLYMLVRARELGLTARVIEAGDDVGGTWYWNRYPGARCDIESLEYSYGFDEALQQEWHWSERFAPQPEILSYARHVAERFDLRRDITFGTRVVRATYQEAGTSHRSGSAGAVRSEPESGHWRIGTDKGAAYCARFVVMATGCLSSANRPAIAGMETFAGPIYHTGQWPREPVDFSGLRVGVIGTGSSAVQSIPVIARQARALTVFQRTATYSVPAWNAPLDAGYEATVKGDYQGFRQRNALMPAGFGSNLNANPESALAASPEARERAFDARWQSGGLGFTRAFGDIILNDAANAFAADYVRRKIAGIVKDAEVARLLSPSQPVACKRLCVDTGYYEAFNLPHVRLVDISANGIEAITPAGIQAGGQLHELDVIVCATGFDAMTGTLLKMDLRGRGGVTLAEKWRAGPLNYLGLMVAGFPNLFTITGPGSPSVLTNMMVSIEQHVRWIGDCVAWMREQGRTSIEAEEAAERDWVGHVNAMANQTIFPGCNSWYLGANVPGKTRVFMPLPGFPAYVERCETVMREGYRGFRFA